MQKNSWLIQTDSLTELFGHRKEIDSLYGGQITLSTLFLKPNVHFHRLYPPPPPSSTLYMQTMNFTIIFADNDCTTAEFFSKNSIGSISTINAVSITQL